MVGDQVGGLGVEETLDAVQTWQAERTERDIGIFVAAAHFADLHHPGSRPDSRPHREGRDNGGRRAGRALPGMEQAKRLGGPGTPMVLEFAAAEFALRLGRSAYAGRALIADALDVRHRLPKVWARVCGGEVAVGYARYVAQQTRHLSQEAAGLVDAGVAPYADGRLGWSRFETLVAAKIVEADPEAAAEAERKAAEEEFAKLGRSNEHGQKTLYVKSSAAALARVDATIAYHAAMLGALGDTDTEDLRRAKAVLIMANPVAGLQLLQTYATHRTTHRDSPETPEETRTDGDGPGDGSADGGTADGPGGAVDRLEGDADTGDAFDDLDDSSDTGNGGDSDGDSDDVDGQPRDPVAAFLKPFRPDQVGLGQSGPGQIRHGQVQPEAGFGCGFDPRKLLPQVTVYLHLYARTDTGEVGPVTRWEGEGPITTEYVRDILGPSANFVVKPVIDLAGMAPVDGYEVPDRLREAVHLRTPADVYPWAANTGRRKQQDHTRPYVHPDHRGPPAPAAQTGLGNLGPMTQFHHRVKTHGPLELKQPYPGIYLWRDRFGHCYLVDHTGTRKAGRTDPGVDLPDLTLEVYPDDPNVDLSYHLKHAM